jgi:hypothetical protein
MMREIAGKRRNISPSSSVFSAALAPCPVPPYRGPEEAHQPGQKPGKPHKDIPFLVKQFARKIDYSVT